MLKYILTVIPLILFYLNSYALTVSVDPDSIDMGRELNEVVVAKRVSGLRKLNGIATNTDVISSGELKRAACCNLGESFTTNPSVDVNYSDAATGAKQVKLLGLPGTYVQMLIESVLTVRGGCAVWTGMHPGSVDRVDKLSLRTIINCKDVKLKALILALFMALSSVAAFAADNNRTACFTLSPKMSCANCEKKIKTNLRFEKGVKSITTSIPNQKVEVVFNPEKTNEENLIKAFKKLGYKATPVVDKSDSSSTKK